VGAGLALGVGLLLGAVFFGGLWWTVQRGLHARNAALWFSLSMVLRTGVTLVGFVLVAHGSWSRLAICLAGFAVARLIVTRLTSLAARAASPAPSPVAAGTGHAP
jgi:F1F0 ATPase subunit 2